ncbi:MAG: chemotaxis protein CheW [Xanthobacteraceae bacterium]
MAKATQRAAASRVVAAAHAEAAVLSSAGSAQDQHLVVFRIADEALGFRLDHVEEIIRLPDLAHMPLAPRSLLGLANLRGAVLPIVSLRRLLDLPDAPPDAATRVIVTDHGAAVGFVVDRIDDLLALAANQVEKDDAGAGSIDPHLLDGVVKGAEGDTTIKILNPQRLLRDEFARLGISGPRGVTPSAIPAAASAPAATEPQQQVSLVSFDLGGQEYALPLDRVREIIPLPDQVSEVPRSETAVLGVVTLRDRLLPLVSLRALLGLPSDDRREERGKVVVLSMGSGAVGMVADRTREIIRIDPGLIDPAPALLTRGEGDAEIISICRLDHGRRLVAVLSPDRLFRSDLVRRVLSEQGNASDDLERQTDHDAMADEQFVIFRLGDQEYGLPIGAVDEIARPPDQISRLPKAPAFIDGVMNLRGSVVPIVDLRRRFELASKEPGSARRILVLAVGGGKTGFMVDGVSEVMRVPLDAIRPAPELSSEQMRLISRVANLEAEGRMILLVDPAQLLDRLEADVLAKFDRSGAAHAPKAS